MQGRNCWCTKGARWLPVADEDDKNSQQQKQHGKRNSGSRSQPKLGLISLLGGNLHEFTRSSRKELALSELNSKHNGYHILIRPSNLRLGVESGNNPSPYWLVNRCNGYRCLIRTPWALRRS